MLMMMMMMMMKMMMGMRKFKNFACAKAASGA